MDAQFVTFFNEIASSPASTLSAAVKGLTLPAALSAAVKGLTLSAALTFVTWISPYIIGLYDKMRPKNKAIKDAKEYLEFLKMRGEFANLFGGDAATVFDKKAAAGSQIATYFYYRTNIY
jgi:hypothetical protein